MTRKRLRYSELAAAASVPAEEAPTPAAEQNSVLPEAAPPTPPSSALDETVADVGASFEPLVVERDDDAPLIDALGDRPIMMEPFVVSFGAIVPEARKDATVEHADSTPTRPRRNSTPVELARTLTAERAAARAQEGFTSDSSDVRDDLVSFEPADGLQRTLRERARSKSGTAELLMFHVGGERLAVELILVDEVIDLPVIHHVPEMPPAMLGVVTIRGSLTPVYSPENALRLPLALRDALLIFRRGSYRVGILIDDVDDALSVDMGELREKPGGEEGDAVLLGVIRLENTLVGIIDADALITSCQSANIMEPA